MSNEPFSIDFPVSKLLSNLDTFDKIFQEEKLKATSSIAKSGATAMKKALDKAITSWGLKRMAGSASIGENGVPRSFTPYGNSAGRNDTGHMIDSVSYQVLQHSSGELKVSVGWVNNKEDYFIRQEYGFQNYGRFAGVTAGGKARFREVKVPLETPPAHSLDAAYKRMKQLQGAFMSRAWNAAKKRYANGGGSANVGTYLEARSAYVNSLNDGGLF
jgi:hypothetical protein